MHCFASVFMCFYCVFTEETCTFCTLHMCSRIHMYHTWYKKYTVLLVFSCVFSVFLLQKHILFGKLYMYTRIHMDHTLYIKCSVLLMFSCVFSVLLLQKHVLLVYFRIIQEYTCTILYKWNALFCKCFHVFSLCLDCTKMYLWYILPVFKNTHVSYFIHEMHCFASVFMCFHCVFTAETCTFGIICMYTRINMYHSLYMKCTVL
jgi:hypothetical protein